MHCPACNRTADTQTTLSFAKKWGMHFAAYYNFARGGYKGPPPMANDTWARMERERKDRAKGIYSRCWLCDMPMRTLG